MTGEIWDYLLRRKPIFGLLLVMLALGGVLGAKIMDAHRPIVSQAQEIGVGPVPTYNNSLTFQILGTSGKPAYELIFASNFGSAKVKVTNEILDSAAAVRFLNPSGQPLASEQTVAQGAGQVFANAPTSYEVTMGRDYALEIQGAKVRVLSNLDASLATAFLPSGNTERYIFTTGGIRKASWSTSEGETQLYNLLKNYITGRIENYKSRLTDEVLNNKNLDVAGKTQIVLAWRSLKGADQEQYREFIEHLRRGGIPQITYAGQRTYLVGEKVDFAALVSARDGEDGVYATSQITTQANVNFGRVGQYEVVYRASDSDGNITTLKIPIAIVAPNRNLGGAATYAQIDTAVGGGVNTSDSIDSTTDSEELADNIVDPEQPQPETELSPEQNEIVVTDSPEKPKARGVSASQIVLIALGIIVLLGLVRFIFDHYVR